MPSSKYEVLSQTVEVLLSPGTALFAVPKFQRRYSWGVDEINRLVGDIFSDSDRDDLPYFLGSIVLASTRNGRDGDSADMILDGQQRLTTLSLIISVLIYKSLQTSADEDFVVSDYNQCLFSRHQKGIRRTKVVLQDDDQKVYEAVLKDPASHSSPAYCHTTIGTAVSKIFQAVDEIATNPRLQWISGRKSPYVQMLDRILYEVELVRITAPTEKDAFRLFETLNDRGLALSAADLIKNKLLSHCGSEIDDAYEAWSNMLSYTKEDDVVSFLRHYWIGYRDFVRKLGLFDTFKRHINSLDSREATYFALELENAAKDYQQIILPNPKSCSWGEVVAGGLERLNLYRARSYRSAILACSHFRRNDIDRVVALCESITVRYSVVGEKNPNVLEAIYSELCTQLRNPTLSLDTILNSRFLAEVPYDKEFRENFRTLEVSSISPAWREILARLNARLGTGETKVVPSGVHIEHILPQNPRTVVLIESAVSAEEATQLCRRVGNLTLLSGRKNREASNKPFSAKRSIFAQSEVTMTNQLAKYSTWGKAEIEARSAELADLAVAVYPHPGKI